MGGFPFAAVRNKATVNVQVRFYVDTFPSPYHIPKSANTGSYCDFFLIVCVSELRLEPNFSATSVVFPLSCRMKLLPSTPVV